MSIKEGRFSRWSRLKRGNEIINTELGKEESIEGKSAEIDFDVSLGSYPSDEDPIIPRKRSSVPFMPPLAGFEEGDTDFESPPIEAIEMFKEGTKVDQPDINALSHLSDEEEDLSEEEKEIVAGLPPIESLTKDSDFTPFLADKVPEIIRRKALKLLWRSDPIFANLDGLNDYDEDFNLIDKLINAATDSLYKVGKGMTEADENPEESIEKTSETKNLSKAPISEDLENSPEATNKTLNESATPSVVDESCQSQLSPVNGENDYSSSFESDSGSKS